MSLSVIGTGFGRTGTLSLKGALETLGFGRCYHMIEVLQTPGHAELWSAAAEGKDVDWEALFAGYGATVDWPSAAFWRQLIARYPDAKVVHTERDPEKWYDSVAATILPAIQHMPRSEHPGVQAQGRMARQVIVEGTFGGRFDDREHAISVYQRHNQEVRDEVPPERLLVFEVSHGWGPLCRFLGRPVPDQGFPRVNSTEEFRGRFGAVFGS